MQLNFYLFAETLIIIKLIRFNYQTINKYNTNLTFNNVLFILKLNFFVRIF